MRFSMDHYPLFGCEGNAFLVATGVVPAFGYVKYCLIDPSFEVRGGEVALASQCDGFLDLCAARTSVNR